MPGLQSRPYFTLALQKRPKKVPRPGQFFAKLQGEFLLTSQAAVEVKSHTYRAKTANSKTQHELNPTTSVLKSSCQMNESLANGYRAKFSSTPTPVSAAAHVS